MLISKYNPPSYYNFSSISKNGQKIGQKLVIFCSNFRPQTATSCGLACLFFLFSTILHQDHRLHMHGIREHIHTTNLPNLISPGSKYLQIPGQAGWLTRYIHHILHPICDYLLNRLRVYAIPRRVKYDIIRFFFYCVKHLEHVSCQEFAVVQSVELGILLCSFHGFLYDFNSHYLLADRCHHLGDGSGSAVKVVYCHLVKSGLVSIHYKLSGCLIEHLCSQRIGLEK